MITATCIWWSTWLSRAQYANNDDNRNNNNASKSSNHTFKNAAIWQLRNDWKYNYPKLVLFDQANYIEWIHVCYILSLIGISVTCYLLRLWGLWGSSSLPVDSKYQKGQSRDTYIILLFNSKFKRQWINVIFSAG